MRIDSRGLALLALVGTLAGDAGAHPMGNVSVSHYAGIEVSPDSVRVKYLLDFAEIPSVRELDRVDPDRNDRVTPEEREEYLRQRTEEVLQRIHLEVNGAPVPLEASWSRVTFPPGEGGLSTVRIAWELLGAWPAPLRPSNFLKWSDRNHEAAPGWKEIRFEARGGLGVGSSSLRAQPASQALDAYPQEYLNDPPTDTKAWCHFGPGMTPETDLEPSSGFGAREKSRFVDLVTSTTGGPGPVAAALLLAMVLGAAHALEPGHGKTIVAAYLVGTRGTVAQAAALGLVVTFTHTFSVFLLGLGVLLLSHYVLPERILPWLGFASGALVTVVGAVLLRDRLRRLRATGASHGHAHDGGHEHHHGSGHHHEHSHGHHSHVPERATLGSILALGISGGLVPCPAGIVVLLSAIALGRVALGLLLIVAFSVGLAAVLMGVAILFVTARRLFDRLPMDGRTVHYLGVTSAVIVTAFGVVLAIRSLSGVHPGAG